jgi:hypothetical protein
MKTTTKISVTLLSLMIFSGTNLIANNFSLSKKEKKAFSKPYSITGISATQGTKDMTKGGFYLLYNPYLPSTKYMFPKELNLSTGEKFDESDKELRDLRTVGKFGFGHGLEIGNMFRIVDKNPMAIGLRVSWFGLGFTGFKANSKYSFVQGFSGTINFLKLGPYFTFKFAEQMAVDAFYQLSPTFNFGGFVGTDESTGETYALPLVGYGLTHQLGITYRFKAIAVGFGYGFGSTKLNLTYDFGDGPITADAKFYGSNLRFILGFKF